MVLALMALLAGPSHNRADEPTGKSDAVAIKESLGFTFADNEQGRVTVAEVSRGGPAEKAGLQAGDVIVTADDKTLLSGASLGHVLRARKLSEPVLFKVDRDGQHLNIGLRPTRRETIESLPTSPGKETGMFGMFVIEDDKGRVVATKVTPQSPAADAGLKQGDMIVSVGSFTPTSLTHLANHIRELDQTGKTGQELTIGIIRGDKSQTVRLALPATRGRGGPKAKPPAASGLAVARLLPLDTAQMPEAVVFVTLQDETSATQVRVSGKGLSPGLYRLTIREYGDVGDALHDSAGEVFPPANGRRDSADDRSPGELGTVEVKEDGTILNQSSIKDLRLAGPNSVLGRAILVHFGSDSDSQPIAGGVIGLANPARAQDPAMAGAREGN